MKLLSLRIAISATIAGTTIAACATRPGDDCEKFRNCDSEGDGDDNGGSGGNGGSGDGDGDTGGNGGSGDGDGGTGGTVDPCDACSGDTPLCDDNNECVECLEATDCPEAAASTCNAGTCEACTEDTDCAHIEEANICEAGTCVECTPATETDDCGANSCDPATNTCTTTARESVDTCEACLSDSECVANHHCVPMEFPSGTARAGGYCLELAPGCTEPYSVGISARTTLSGVSGETYCGINEDLATCEAVRALEDNWRCDSTGPGDGQCWPTDGTVDDAVEVPGAICRTVGVLAGDRCTYACAVDANCTGTGTPGESCGPGTAPDPVTPDYCGGQD